MRHPTTGLSEDDLSRLTGSSSSSATSGHNCLSSSSTSSSTSSSSSSSASTTPANVPAKAHKADKEEQQTFAHELQRNGSADTLKNNNKNAQQALAHSQQQQQQKQHQPATRFSSTYLPEIINPLEWQKSSRKRKERLDSTSSTTQDRKLQRSNSEELLPQDANEAVQADGAGDNVLKSSKTANDVIRRVSSEDFKRTASYAAYEQDIQETDAAVEAQAKESTAQAAATDENDASLANRQKQQQQQQQQEHQQQLPRIYAENWMSSGPMRDMTRRTRYETSPARSQRHSPIRGVNNSGKHRDSDDSECEHERRRSSERFCKTRAPPGRKAAGVSKKSVAGSGGNNGAKYLPTKRNDENVYKYDLSALKYERRGFISKAKASVEKVANDKNLIDFQQAQAASGSTEQPMEPIKKVNAAISNNNNKLAAAQESLPWDRAVAEDQAPILSRRYARHHPADSIDTAAKLSKVMPYPQQYPKQTTAAQLLADDMDCMDPVNTFRAFTSLENVRTRDVMQQVLPAMMAFQTPEERLKQVNKRHTALKKKLTQLEEAFESRMGYRPSQAERLNDKYMKNILAELSKLRKERHELKADPMGPIGLKLNGGMDATQKLVKIKSTLTEIEQNLTDKREDSNRSETLDELTPDQLVQEKSAVQHGLLYFESLYGRPASKEERDAARPLYDRYRQLKRLVSRSVLLSGSAAAGAPELPTILEHEAMVFESTPQQYSSNNSTETTNSPSDSAIAPTGSSDDSATTGHQTQESSTATATTTTTTTANAAEMNENVSALSLEQLWEHLDKTREEKKLLKRTIREYETVFEEQNGRKMLKNDRKLIEDTYAQYKEKKAKTRLLQALIKKHISR